MLSEADRAVLDESFQNTRMAGEAIHMVIGKVEDEDLALDLNRQACSFLQFEEKLQQMYAREHETPPRDHVVDKTMLWGGIQMNTLMDDSTEKLADMIYSQLHEDLPFGFEMLLMASQNILGSGIVEEGIVSVIMPLKGNDLISTVDMMIQATERRKRRQRLKPKERNPEETALIRQAKELLMDRNHLSEEEAHRYIQKCSMDSGTNMVETAQMVLIMMQV